MLAFIYIWGQSTSTNRYTYNNVYFTHTHNQYLKLCISVCLTHFRAMIGGVVDSHLSTAWPLYEFNNSMHPPTHTHTHTHNTYIHMYPAEWMVAFVPWLFVYLIYHQTYKYGNRKTERGRERERERAKVEWSYRKQTFAHYNLDSNINCKKAVIVMWKIRHLRNCSFCRDIMSAHEICRTL